MISESTSWHQIPDLIKAEIRQLDAILDNFPYISDQLETRYLSIALTNKFAIMLNRANLTDSKSIEVKNSLASKNYYTVFEDISRFKDAIMFGDKDEKGKLRYQWLKFKAKYVVWAKNLISKLNAIKQREAPWLDIRTFAQEIAQLETL